MEHENLIKYLTDISGTKFGTSLGVSGGYIRFKNSGQGGSVKEFTLSLESILKGLEDIIDNLGVFQSHQSYVEREWRDLGAKYFSDVTLNSMITVQTKPTVTTFSKLICWANNLDYLGDGNVPLSKEYLSNATVRLKGLIESYKPKNSQNTRRAIKKGDVVELPKPFLLLAGISGTGKTRFVREQAEAHGVGSKNFCLVPVRPDWHEPSDLLGYVSRIGKSPEYVSTKVLQFMIDAWRAIAPSANKNGMGELNYSSPPYWLCLDEMNLAPVEQYFADYLSVLESKKFIGGKYHCDPLLDKTVLITNGANVQEDLGLGNDQDLWDFFLEYGIPLPPNLIVAGTVNMDETTHGFSRKVIDRALTLDFGEFFPNDYDKFFEGQDNPKTLTYGMNTQITKDTIFCSVDSDGKKSIAFLNNVNDVLRNTPFELAYRALNELLLHVVSFAPETDAQLQAVWDDFLMTKVLPRIDGDEDKLRCSKGEGEEASNLLDKLQKVVAENFPEVWGEDKTRIDLLRVQHDEAEINDVVCRAKNKIKWMKERLDANTFTSYWP